MANDLIKVGAIIGGLLLLDNLLQGGGASNIFGGGGIMGGLLGGDMGGTGSLLSNDDDPTTDEDIGVSPVTEGPNLNPGVAAAVSTDGTLLGYTPRSVAIQQEVTALVRAGGSGVYAISGQLTRNLEDVVLGAAAVSPGSVVKPGQYESSSGTFKNSALVVPTSNQASGHATGATVTRTSPTTTMSVTSSGVKKFVINTR